MTGPSRAQGERVFQTSVIKRSSVEMCGLMGSHDRKAGSDHQELETMILVNRIKLMDTEAKGN